MEGTLKLLNKGKKILSENHVVFVLQDTIKLERICKHESSRQKVYG